MKSNTWDRAWKRREARGLVEQGTPLVVARQYVRCEAEGRSEIEARYGLARAKAAASYITRYSDGSMRFEYRLG